MHGGSVMLYLLSPKVWIALAVVAFLAFTHVTAYRKGSANVRSEWTLSIAQGNAEARALEKARQRRADEAAGLAATAANRDRVALAHVRAERDGMRGTLDAIERASRESHEAATKHVAALRT